MIFSAKSDTDEVTTPWNRFDLALSSNQLLATTSNQSILQASIKNQELKMAGGFVSLRRKYKIGAILLVVLAVVTYGRVANLDEKIAQDEGKKLKIIG